jgi:hypothetical protein
MRSFCQFYFTYTHHVLSTQKGPTRSNHDSNPNRKDIFPELPVWWHVENELFGLELLEFPAPIFFRK